MVPPITRNFWLGRTGLWRHGFVGPGSPWIFSKPYPDRSIGDLPRWNLARSDDFRVRRSKRRSEPLRSPSPWFDVRWRMPDSLDIDTVAPPVGKIDTFGPDPRPPFVRLRVRRFETVVLTRSQSRALSEK